ncbi:hypothetical protein CBM2625_U10032 [Cupriavidus taiwanensis]|nr:hypothetical protein CBM2625_U10032 [Cupriavidus taiwanensis]
MFCRHRTGFAGADKGPSRVDGRVNPQDLHRLGFRQVAEAVRDVRGNERGIQRLEPILEAVDVEHCIAFHEDDAFLAVVAVERNLDSWGKRGVPGNEAVRTDGFANQRRRARATATVIVGQLVGNQQYCARGGLDSHE